MKRSEINGLIRDAKRCFWTHGWTLPSNARWDVTDFGLGNWEEHGLLLVNLADEPEYCEKLMYAKAGMKTPAHCHRKKKEDIIARWGSLRIRVWSQSPDVAEDAAMKVQVNGEMRRIPSGGVIYLNPGERVTLAPGVWHEMEPASSECIIGEVSTANDDVNDNFFANQQVGRYPVIEEDEPASVRLLSDR